MRKVPLIAFATGRSKGSRRCSENKSGAEKKKSNTKPRLEEGIHRGVDFGVVRSQRIGLRRSPVARKSATSFPPEVPEKTARRENSRLRALVSSTETTVERQRRARAVIDTQSAYPASSSSAHFLSTERSARPVTIRFAPPRATTHTRVVVESGVPCNSSLRAARNICRAGKEKLYSPLAGFQGGGPRTMGTPPPRAQEATRDCRRNERPARNSRAGPEPAGRARFACDYEKTSQMAPALLSAEM
ncbi:hypothetical protein HPB51_012731 [Rhipicephalus microplus]|uniref:Uncharacterized protein n=1 Tax=Rhipicephalus microplus TaxID=6941 RepID=A0A9J6E929_RHIMP|nr:hypothetical protein HPB51_012731 [Rhipicephalus microplus]